MAKRKKSRKKPPAAPPPPPLPTWREKYWNPFITPIEVAISIGLWATGISVSDYVVAGILLGIGLLVAVVGIWAKTSLKHHQQALYSILALAIFGLGGGIVFVRHDAGRSPSLPAMQEQVKEFRSLQAFLTGGEQQLREKFDISTLLEFNINVENSRIQWDNAGNSDRAFPYPNQRYVHVAEGHFDTKHGKIFPGEKLGPNGVGLKEGPEDIFILSGTEKNDLATKQLDEFIASPLIPESVKSSLRELKSDYAKNIDLMFAIFGELRKKDVRYFTQYHDYDTPFGDVISNEYYSKFQPLEPSADKALKKMQTILKTD